MIGGLVGVSTLARGLLIGLSPRYTTSESQDGAVDVNGFTVGLQGAYQFRTGIALIAGYNFFRQRSEGVTTGNDVDQNRVFVGVQFGYPIRFD